MECGAIALLDVLGWKGIWQRSGSDPLDKLNSLVSKAKERALDLVRGDRGEEFRQRFAGLDPEVISISDTIAFAVKGDLQGALECAVLLSATTLTRAIDMGLPLRGAISYGRFLSQGNILLGPAVDEVASWYEQADWIGVHLTPSAELQVDTSKFIQPNVLVSCKLPIKGGGRKGLACNWPFYYQWDAASMDERRRTLIGELLKLGPMTSDVGLKTMNSVDFFDSNCRKQ